MKRIGSLCLAAWMAVCCIGCAVPAGPVPTVDATPVPTQSPSPTEAPTPSPTPEPEGELAVARTDGAGILWKLLERGYAANVLGQRENYYIIAADGVEALVEKRFVRLSSDAPYESWTGYTKANTSVYTTAYMEGDPIATLKRNTEVTVLDAPGDLYLITWEDQQGYVLQTTTGKNRATGGGGNGGGSGGGGGGGADGGDIQLSTGPVSGTVVRLFARYAAESSPAPEAPVIAFPCAGTVIADKTEAYLVILGRGDPVQVIGSDERCYQVLTDSGVGTIPKPLIRLLSEVAYTEWDGYADDRASFYADYRMKGAAEELKRNTEIHVLDDLGDCYLVEMDGTLGYIPKIQAGEEKYEVPFGGGGNGGGGGGGGQEWTDPVL